MGLDISHGTWHGAYTAFMAWRKKIADVAGFPPLELMEGFYSEEDNVFSSLKYSRIGGVNDWHFLALDRLTPRLPIKWTLFEKDPLYHLLYHSDCDGEITYGRANKIADRLEGLQSLLPDEDAGGHIGNWRKKTKTFIDGCRIAYSKKENLKFG